MFEKYEKKIVIIADPNGAGKTTFAREFLPNDARCPIFVNADLIAEGLSPFGPDRVAMVAGRLMLAQIRQHVRNNKGFAFETTLSGKRYASLIPEWQATGYRIKLVFLKLPTVETAIERVAVRVTQGGHAIPENVIRRRFDKGLRNFNEIYRFLLDAWQVFDNSGERPILLEEGP